MENVILPTKLCKGRFLASKELVDVRGVRQDA